MEQVGQVGQVGWVGWVGGLAHWAVQVGLVELVGVLEVSLKVLLEVLVELVALVELVEWVGSVGLAELADLEASHAVTGALTRCSLAICVSLRYCETLRPLIEPFDHFGLLAALQGPQSQPDRESHGLDLRLRAARSSMVGVPVVAVRTHHGKWAAFEAPNVAPWGASRRKLKCCLILWPVKLLPKAVDLQE